MNIGFDAKRAFHNSRGLGNYSRTLIENLCRYYPDQAYYLFTPKFDGHKFEAWYARCSSSHIVKPESFFSKKFSSAWRSIFLKSVLEKYPLDIFHGLSHELPPGIKQSKIKSVVTIHDLIYLRFPDFFPRVDRTVYHKKVQYAVENSDQIIAICQQTKDDLINFLNIDESKVKIIYQAINPLFYQYSNKFSLKNLLQLEKDYILYVGALEERKNALLLVEAFGKLAKEIDHHLVLVGRGREYKKKIQQRVSDLDLKDRVLILDDIQNDQLPGIYKDASLFVYPSFFEGWGIPNVEALVSKVPVITSNVSCLPESSGPKSIHIDPNSVEELVEAILKVLKNQDLQVEMIESGLTYAENFHPKKVTDKLHELYQSLL